MLEVAHQASVGSAFDHVKRGKADGCERCDDYSAGSAVGRARRGWLHLAVGIEFERLFVVRKVFGRKYDVSGYDDDSVGANDRGASAMGR